MTLTLSVRSFHVPDTPRTVAWPPRLPSVPTSRATRVTSSANAESWSTIVLMVSLSSRISPRASTRIFCDRSPLATAVVTWAIERTCAVRLSAMTLTDSVRSFQVPETPLTSAWPPSRPSVPTSRATRVTSSANADSWSTIVFRVFFSSRISPRAVDVDLLRQVAARHRGGDLGDVADLGGQVARHEVHRVGQVAPGARDALDVGLAAEPALGTDLARHSVTSSANDDSWSTIVLIVFLSSRISPRASTVIFCDRSPLATAVVTWAMLRTWSVRLPGHEVHRVGEVAPDAADAGDLGLAAEAAFAAHLARHPGDLVGERGQLVHHRVDGVLQLEDLAAGVHVDLLRQVALGDRGGHLGDVADLGGQVAGHGVHRVGEVLPGARTRRGPSACPPSCPSVPTSRATRVTSEVNSDSWSTMPLKTVAISPSRPSAVRRAAGCRSRRRGRRSGRPAAGAAPAPRPRPRPKRPPPHPGAHRRPLPRSSVTRFVVRGATAPSAVHTGWLSIVQLH